MIFLRRHKSLIFILIISILTIILSYFIIKFFPIYSVVFIFIGKMLLPFLLASFVSYLLHPIVDYLVSIRINRTIAVLIIFVTFIIIIFAFGYFTLPMLTRQLIVLIDQLPMLFYTYEQFIYDLYESTVLLLEIVHDKMTEFINHLEVALDKKTSQWINKFSNIFDFVIILTIIPVLVFYFLKDFEKIKENLQSMLNKKDYYKAEVIMSAIDDSLGKYIRGQVIISLSITFITLVAYHLLKIKYALILALFAGLMNVIPYFGPVIGLVPALLISLTMSWKTVIFVIMTTIIVQMVEGSFLSPYIIGKSVQIHPIFIILSLLVGVEIGGIIGMVFIIPLVTICKGVFQKMRQLNSQSH